MTRLEIIDKVLEELEIIDKVLEELDRAEQKFPSWPRDPIHAAAVVNEESGELVRAALQATYESGDPAEMEKEAIHTAAMAIRFLMHYEYYAPIKSLQVKL